MKLTKSFKFWFLLIFGFFLLLDGILSIWFGMQFLPADIPNNSIFGNIVRVIRALGGAVLLVIAFFQR